MDQKIAKRQARQGDVLLTRVKEIPKNVEPRNSKTVAEGEATGHNHAFPETGSAVLVAQGDNIFARLITVEPLTHPGHGWINFDSGEWEVNIQREYHPQEVRRVQD